MLIRIFCKWASFWFLTSIVIMTYAAVLDRKTKTDSDVELKKKYETVYKVSGKVYLLSVILMVFVAAFILFGFVF